MHGGGIDLIFPHHEGEIAQMESISGKKPLVKYWVHTGFLYVEGKKMSKSLGNFITIEDALQKHNYKILRYVVLSSQYRSPINFSEQILDQAENSLKRINEAITKLDPKGKDNIPLIEEAKKKFYLALDNDFTTPEAFAVLVELVKEINKEGGGKETLQFVKGINDIFDIFTFQEKIPKEIMQLVKKREEVKKMKLWKESDELRNEIVKRGYVIDDAKEGTIVKKKE